MLAGCAVIDSIWDRMQLPIARVSAASVSDELAALRRLLCFEQSGHQDAVECFDFLWKRLRLEAILARAKFQVPWCFCDGLRR